MSASTPSSTSLMPSHDSDGFHRATTTVWHGVEGGLGGAAGGGADGGHKPPHATHFFVPSRPRSETHSLCAQRTRSLSEWVCEGPPTHQASYTTQAHAIGPGADSSDERLHPVSSKKTYFWVPG